MALGAKQRDVLKLMMGEGAKLSLCGVALGLFASLGLSRFLSACSMASSLMDPATFVVVSGVLITAALLASYLPARRATKVDPIRTRCATNESNTEQE